VRVNAWRSRLRSLLSPPAIEDPEGRRLARILYPITLCILGLMAAVALAVAHPTVTSAPEVAWFVQGIISATLLGVLGLVRLGRVRLAGAIFSCGLWFLVTLITWFMGGINGPTIAVYVMVSVMAGFLWGGRGMAAFTGLSVAAGLGMLLAEQAGLRPEPRAPVTLWYAWLIMITSLVVTAVLARLSMGATERALTDARHAERAAVDATRAVEAGRALLETRAREQAAVAELGQRALAETDVDAILSDAARVIARTLDVAWVSVLERLPGDQEILLRAGVGWPEESIGQARFPMSLATQAGYTLLTGEAVVVEELEREKRFPASVGLKGLGVVSSLSAVIPGEDANFGVLGVHSDRRREYSEDDIRFLEAVANLIALAIRRARASHALRSREEELRQAQKMEAVGRLAGGIAHDFNNLLTAISGYTNLLIRSLDPAHPGRDDAEEIRRMAEQAASLTRQILAFSRRQVMRPEVIDLNRVIRDTESMLRRLIGEDVDLSTHLAGDLEPVRADPGQIEQVLLNLVVNSRDAMPRGGSLSIATCNEPGASGAEPRVRLEVTDTGAGMDAETQARAFDPFFTTKDRFKGTGLGLSTVYGIVQQSGGSIALQSRPALGTTVEIVLPAAAGRPAALRVPAVAPAPVRGSETVLLAEDEPTVRRLLNRILDESGYRVIEASNGAEALERAEAHEGTLHLVITDVIMPEMGGTELVERMKHVHPEAKVLYVSGYADEALGQRGVVPGNEAFLAKPFTPEALARKVREILDAPSRR
jgi:two-component system cell cycle sensor histidine kinase/response regulator CckA